MSITRTSPACALPGRIQRPGLAAWNVAVATATTAGPATSPVDASTPLGVSAATTGDPLAQIASIASRAPPVAGPLAPVPSTASRITAGICDILRTTAVSLSRSKLCRASPVSSSGSTVQTTSTSRPSLPQQPGRDEPVAAVVALPQTTAIRPFGSDLAGQPGEAGPGPLHQLERRDPERRSIAHASSARICAASGSGSSQSCTLSGPARRRRPSRGSGSSRSRRRGRARRPARAPLRGARRAPRAAPLITSISSGRSTSSRSAFETASFAQKRAARCWPGRARDAA